MDPQRTVKECVCELRRLDEQLSVNRAERTRLELKSQRLEDLMLELLEEMKTGLQQEEDTVTLNTSTKYTDKPKRERVQNASRWRPIESELDRCTQISKIVGKSREILEKQDDERIQKNDVIVMLRKTVQLLFTHPDYPNNLKPDLANNFAALPSEIVYDVIESASYEDAVDASFQNLALLDASWSDYAKEFRFYMSLRSTQIDDNNDDLNQLKTNAPQLHDRIQFFEIADNSCEILELFGTRFSTVNWTDYRERSELALVQAASFLKRQLKSKYLRTLQISCSNIQTEELNNLFVQFVKRPPV